MLKYEQIVIAIRKRIEDGTYQPGSQLPTTEQLCAAFQVSKITITRAMDELVKLGIVARRRGAGTFVTKTSAPHYEPFDWTHETKINGTTARYMMRGKSISTHVHEFSVVRPEKSVQDKFGTKDSFMYYVCRTRFMDGEPLNIEYAYFPISIASNLTEEIASGSIYQYLTKELSLTISNSHAAMRAVLPTEQEREWLGIACDTPLLEVEQVVFLNSGQAFEYSISRNTEIAGPTHTVRLYD